MTIFRALQLALAHTWDICCQIWCFYLVPARTKLMIGGAKLKWKCLSKTNTKCCKNLVHIQLPSKKAPEAYLCGVKRPKDQRGCFVHFSSINFFMNVQKSVSTANEKIQLDLATAAPHWMHLCWIPLKWITKITTNSADTIITSQSAHLKSGIAWPLAGSAFLWRELLTERTKQRQWFIALDRLNLLLRTIK